MKSKQLLFIGFLLVIGLIASLTLGLAACYSKTTTPRIILYYRKSFITD